MRTDPLLHNSEMAHEKALLEALADGEWHTWGDLAALAERNLGREMVFAHALSGLVSDGRVEKKDPNTYRIASMDLESAANSFLRASLDAFNVIRGEHDLTHAGSMPASLTGTSYVIWGLRYPDPTLLVYRITNQFTPIWRDDWEALTTFAPPWPWNEAGTALVIPDEAGGE